MKSVTFSDIERVPGQVRLPGTNVQQRAMALALLLALGLPVLMIVFHLLDPTAPLSFIVLPVLAGGLLPMTRMMRGRFEVMTRFDACHMVGTLDDALGRLGYTQAERLPGAVRYSMRHSHLPPGSRRDVAVVVRAHVLEVTGPVQTLRALRREMRC